MLPIRRYTQRRAHTSTSLGHKSQIIPIRAAATGFCVRTDFISVCVCVFLCGGHFIVQSIAFRVYVFVACMRLNELVFVHLRNHVCEM